MFFVFIFLGGIRQCPLFEIQHLSLTFLVIIVLCFDRPVCDGSLNFVSGVITKRHTKGLITNPASNKDASVLALSSQCLKHIILKSDQ